MCDCVCWYVCGFVLVCVGMYGVCHCLSICVGVCRCVLIVGLRVLVCVDLCRL